MVLDPKQTVHSVWGEHRYEDIQEVGRQDGSVLVVPIGSHEQHGHHLPTGTDTILVNEIAHLGAHRAGGDVPILVTPPIWTGYSPHHMPFGGTITIGLETMLSLVRDVVDSALENGFDALVLVNGHGGNKSITSDLVSEIGIEHPEVDVHGVTYFTLAGSFVDEVRDSDPGGMGHGGEFETSLMLYLRPELVNSDTVEGTIRGSAFSHGGTDMFVGGPLSSYNDFSEYSESGAIGEPSLATAEKGEEFYDRLGDEMETILREVHENAVE